MYRHDAAEWMALYRENQARTAGAPGETVGTVRARGALNQARHSSSPCSQQQQLPPLPDPCCCHGGIEMGGT